MMGPHRTIGSTGHKIQGSVPVVSRGVFMVPRDIRGSRTATASRCTHCRMKPFRGNCTRAINVSLHHILLDSVRNVTVATIHVGNTSRRFAAISNVTRSIASVVVTLGRMLVGAANTVPRRLAVDGGNPYIMATNSFRATGTIAVIGPRLPVTAMTTNTRFRLATSVTVNCNFRPTG